MLPRRLLRARSLRWAVRRILGEARFQAQAEELAAWSRENDGAERAAELVERYAPR
jgi:UDP:flavonoid glycosyltransferase YjiC (YdhE family)